MSLNDWGREIADKKKTGSQSWWSPDESRQAVNARKTGLKYREIVIPGRTAKAIKRHLQRIGL